MTNTSPLHTVLTSEHQHQLEQFIDTLVTVLWCAFEVGTIEQVEAADEYFLRIQDDLDAALRNVASFQPEGDCRRVTAQWLFGLLATMQCERQRILDHWVEQSPARAN